MEQDNRDIPSIAYVKVSKHREKVFLYISNKIKMPSEISKETGLKIDDVSRALRSLKKKELVCCLNENDKRGRLYELTEKGKSILSFIKE